MIGSGTLTKQIAGYLARTGYEVNGRKVKGRRRAWCRATKPEISPPLFSKRQRKP